MRVDLRIFGHRVVSAFTVALVLGALCFSFGEGLRLAPFAVTAIETAPTVDATGEPTFSVTQGPTSTSSYGPMDLRVSSQKRGKSSSTPLAPAIQRGYNQPPLASVRVRTPASVAAVSACLIARPPGRAPPFLA